MMGGTESSQTHRWRKPDSNRWSHFGVSTTRAPADVADPKHPSCISNPSCLLISISVASGTGGSNPVSSTGESVGNPTSGGASVSSQGCARSSIARPVERNRSVGDGHRPKECDPYLAQLPCAMGYLRCPPVWRAIGDFGFGQGMRVAGWRLRGPLPI